MIRENPASRGTETSDQVIRENPASPEPCTEASADVLVVSCRNAGPQQWYSELLLYTREEVQSGLEARGWEDCSDLIDGTYRTGEGEDSEGEGGEGECAGGGEVAAALG